jgi:hypothetical protein
MRDAALPHPVILSEAARMRGVVEAGSPRSFASWGALPRVQMRGAATSGAARRRLLQGVAVGRAGAPALSAPRTCAAGAGALQ